MASSWIHAHNSRLEEDQRREQAAQVQRAANVELFRETSQSFWKRFNDRLAQEVPKLPLLKDAELAGHHFTQKQGPEEEMCSIGVNRVSAKHGPDTSTLNIWFRPGQGTLRTRHNHVPTEGVQLSMAKDGTVMAQYMGRYFEAEKFADVVLREMASRMAAIPL